ncbi:MAG TPA: hypothetical protein VN655_01490 [Pseudolabrys sp.]|nr:hypothetical protein [Pseudolabrys sp.]
MAGEIERWHDFYVLVGTAGATLVALLFVAVSIGTGFLTEQRAAPTRAFYSPVVLHFTAVFFISAAGLVPAHTAVFFAGSVAVAALIGGGASVFATVQLLRNRWTSYVQDHLAYGLLPMVCYAVLLIAAYMIVTGAPYALDVVGGTLLVLMIVNIRNAWDLMLSMVRHQAEHR